ncbi:hypothetical protein ACJIZ3_012886 [Penstemon smallii]|uniref:Myb/SANT-like domain-containing protein n=1 Tax=Penstemon smallii TaxID=265156 RepID=A0ABD3UNA9_9LAMI
MDPYINFFMTPHPQSQSYSQSQSQSHSMPENNNPMLNPIPNFNSNPNPTRIQRGRNSDHFLKASWDSRSSEMFIKLCVDEANLGNRPGSHFNKTGWDNLVKKFAVASSRNYTKAQLKNKWDNLKKEWSQWKTLLCGETGLGWDHDKCTVIATDEWWARKLQANPEASKFKEKGPLLPYDQDLLFSDVIANGSSVWTPNQPDEQSEEELEANHDIGSQPTSDPLNSTPTDGGHAPNTEGRRRTAEELLARIQKKKARKVSTADKIAKCLERMVDAVENDVASSRGSFDTGKYSIQSCLEALDNLGIDESDELWLYSTRLFLKPAIRELFILIKTDDRRLRWLRGQMDRDMHKKLNVLKIK